MTRTREMADALVSKRPPIEVETFEQRKFEPVDSDDTASELRELTPVTVAASYCWRLDVGRDTHWVSQDLGQQLMDALVPTTEDEDQGIVVGTLARVNMDGTTPRYGPVELRAAAWARIQAGVTLHG